MICHAMVQILGIPTSSSNPYLYTIWSTHRTRVVYGLLYRRDILYAHLRLVVADSLSTKK